MSDLSEIIAIILFLFACCIVIASVIANMWEKMKHPEKPQDEAAPTQHIPQQAKKDVTITRGTEYLQSEKQLENKVLIEKDSEIKQENIFREYHKLKLDLEHYKSTVNNLRYATASDYRNKIIGDHYERFVGWVFYRMGFSVYFNGLIKGMDDEGIDLIAERNNEVLIIQCKCWKRGSVYPMNILTQLDGSASLYKIESRKNIHIRKILVTVNRSYTDRFKQVAHSLNIELFPLPLIEFPLVRFNKSYFGIERSILIPSDSKYDAFTLKDTNVYCFSDFGELEKWLKNEYNLETNIDANIIFLKKLLYGEKKDSNNLPAKLSVPAIERFVTIENYIPSDIQSEAKQILCNKESIEIKE